MTGTPLSPMYCFQSAPAFNSCTSDFEGFFALPTMAAYRTLSSRLLMTAKDGSPRRTFLAYWSESVRTWSSVKLNSWSSSAVVLGRRSSFSRDDADGDGR